MDIRIVNLRAIAIFIVILGHSIILYDPSWGLYHSEVAMPLFEYVKQHLINPIQMPIFFFISGFLFYRSVNGRNQLSFKKFFLSKFIRLIIPYFCIAILWMNPIKYLVRAPGYSALSEIPTVLVEQFLFSGFLGHLWYLPTLLGVYIIAFLCVKFLYKNIKCKYHIYWNLLLFVSFLLLYYLRQFVPSYFCLASVANYLVFFFGGYLFACSNGLLKTNIPPFFFKKIVVWSCWVLALLGSCSLVYLRPLFLLLLIVVSYWLIPNKTNNLISSISERSFGIYLFHSPLIYITYTYFINSSPWLVLFLNFIVMGVVSYILTICISKTKIKFIIGEK